MLRRDQSGRCLLTGQTTSGIEAARSCFRLLRGTAGTFGGDAKRKAQASKARPTVAKRRQGTEPSVERRDRCNGGGAKGRRHLAGMGDQPGDREESRMTCKSYDIPKTLIWEAWLHVKANQGAAGIDTETIERFETKLAANLYKLWNRMSSGSYFPPPVKAVPIPKKSGGVRVLGIPTVSDRIAQTAVKMWLEPRLDPLFHDDSYGYRPGKSALEAIAVTRRRCWDQDWVVEFDIRGLFDNLDHGLLMTALRQHCQEPWILLYVERWLKAPTVGLAFRAWAFRLASPPKVPAVQRIPEGALGRFHDY